MNKAGFVIALGCISTVAALAFFWKKSESTLAPEVKRAVVSAPKPSDPVDASAQTTQTSSPSSETGAVLLNKKLLQARDLRVFVEEAKQRPQDGGIFFAKSINWYCWDVRELINQPALKAIKPDESHKVASKRDAATDRLRSLCSGFLESEAEGKGYVSLVKSDASKVDPLMKAEANIREAASSNDSSKRKQAVLEFINNPAPLLVINAPLVQVMDGGLVFDGKRYGSRDDDIGGFNLQAARFLAACKFGDNCGETDRFLLLPCARDGICAKDRFEYIAALLANDPNSSSSRYQEVIALSDKFADAILHKNVDAFRRLEEPKDR